MASTHLLDGNVEVENQNLNLNLVVTSVGISSRLMKPVSNDRH